MATTKQIELNNIHTAARGNTVLDNLLLASIFSLFLSENTKLFLELTGRFFLYPFAAVFSAIQAALLMREAHLQQQKSLWLRASISLVSALAITTAVAGALLIGPLFALAAPIIFTATLGTNALYQLGEGIYHTVQAYRVHEETRHEQLTAAKQKFITGTLGAMSAVTVGLVMIAGQALFGILGVASGVLGAVVSIYNGFKTYRNNKNAAVIDKPLVGNSDSEVKEALLAARANSTPGATLAVTPQSYDSFESLPKLPTTRLISRINRHAEYADNNTVSSADDETPSLKAPSM